MAYKLEAFQPQWVDLLDRLRLFPNINLSKIAWSAALERIFPPVVVGPVIIIIGMGLAPVAVDMAN